MRGREIKRVEPVDGVKRVLIVEPEGLVRWAVQQRLEASGFHVIQAADAHQARQHADEADIAVVDVRDSEGGRLSLAADLRQAKPTRPLILVTSDKSPALEERARALGLSIDLEKPYDLETLTHLIRALLSRRQLRQAEAR